LFLLEQVPRFDSMASDGDVVPPFLQTGLKQVTRDRVVFRHENFQFALTSLLEQRLSAALSGAAPMHNRWPNKQQRAGDVSSTGVEKLTARGCALAIRAARRIRYCQSLE
jgi:hypothetical protein